MSRREIVLLVSRAIAILQLVPALTELFFGLPQQILRTRATYPGADSHTLFLNTFRFPALGFSLARTATEFFVAWLFWNCGPTIERYLLPAGSEPEETTDQL